MNTCEKCKCVKDDDEMCGDESGWCFDCHDAWVDREIAHYYPLYLGEVSAGIAGISKDEIEAAIKEAKS